MSHSVCLCYADDDETFAKAVCAALEAKGLPCWMPSRDVSAGSKPEEAIAEAARKSAVLVSLISPNTERSLCARAGVKTAGSRGIPIIGLVIEAVTLSDSLSMLFHPAHALDASVPPLEKHLPGLVEMIRKLLAAQAGQGQGAKHKGEELARGEEGTETAPTEKEGCWKVSLIVEEGAHQGEVLTFSEHDTFVVGRGDDVHLRLPDKYFSRHHFMLEMDPPHCRIMDMGSRNGTRVNGQVIRQVDLKDGDRIQAGRTLIRVSIEAVTAPTGADSSRHGRPSRPPADRSTGSERTPCFSEPVAEAGRQSTIPARRAQLRAADLLKQATDPERIAQYRILRKLGSGGMGVVYQALDPSTGQHVAIKTILPGRAPSGTAVDRFLREASILQELEHPNIVHFREFGESSGTIFIAMDYVDGISGDQLLKELGGPLPVVRAARIVCQLLQALDYAHAKQFVHRDIKPSNLILTAAKGKEVAILTDFGLARAYQTSQLSGLTFSGDVKGTAAFMAPEQILNFRDAKPPVDIYSAGATLYHLLTTKYPYDLPLHFACQIAAVLEQEAIPILSRRPDIPRDLAKLVHKSLAKKPEDRFPKAAAMAKALQPFGQQR